MTSRDRRHCRREPDATHGPRRSPPTTCEPVRRAARRRLPARAGRRPRRRRRAPRRLPARRGRHPIARVELAVRLDPDTPATPEPGRAARSPPAGSNARCATCSASSRLDHPLPRRLVLHQHWPDGWHPMRHDAGPTPPIRRHRRAVPVPHRRRPRRLRDPRRTRPRRPHRTRPLPVLRRRRDHPQDEGPPLVRPQRHREALRRPRPRRRASSSPNGSAATPPSATTSPTASPSKTPSACRVPLAGQLPPRRSCSNSNASTTTSPTSARSATTSATASCTPTPCASANDSCASTSRVTGHRLLRGGIVPGGAHRARPCPTSAELDDIADDVAEIADLALGQQHRRRPLHRHRHPRPPSSPRPRHPRLRRPRLRRRHRRPPRPPLRRPRRRARRPRRPRPATSWPASVVRADEFAASLAPASAGSSTSSPHRRDAPARRADPTHGPSRAPASASSKPGAAPSSTASNSHPTAPSPASRSSTRPSSTGPPCPSPSPTRSSPTSPSPTRASTSPTPATTSRNHCRG